MPLFELEIMYGGTEAGRRFHFPPHVSTVWLACIISSTCQGIHPGYREVPERQTPPRPPGMVHGLHFWNFWFSGHCWTAVASSNKIFGHASFETTRSTEFTKSTRWPSTRVGLALLSHTVSKVSTPILATCHVLFCWMVVWSCTPSSEHLETTECH